ncbi:AAA family ATPase [Lentzea sp. NPDC003310]|uniref:helix-turn-helix transcriptional regulator n=1 Tax=Lentzea sp. NPDC003310 TaxID=3154447 RepID=UPI0033A595E7
MPSHFACTSAGPVPLVGRKQELARCEEMLADTCPGGQVVLIEGDAGIGKSTLVGAVARIAAERGFRGLHCRGVQSETTSGFAALHELLQPLLDRLPALPAGQRRALEVALGFAEGPPPNRLLVGLAALGLLEEYAAEQRVFVVVEDAQWLDASTAQTVAFMARRLVTTSALMIVTMRPDSSELALDAQENTVAEVIRSVVSVEMPLGPLSDEESEELLREQRPALDDHVRQLVLAESSGNPLALVELLGASEGEPRRASLAGDRWWPLTRRLEQAFLSGVSRLPERSRRLLLLVVAAPESSLAQLMTAADAAGLGLDDLAPIERARLAALAGDQVVLRHPLVRSAVYGAASLSERSAAHRLLAVAATDPDRAAWHAAAAVAGFDDEVAAELEIVSVRARARSANTEAVSALRRAAAISSSTVDRTRRLASAAEIARQSGAIEDSVRLVREAWASADDPEVLTLLALTQVALTMSALLPGRSTEDLLGLVDRLAGPTGDENAAQRLRVLATASVVHRVQGLPDGLRDRLLRAIDVAAGQDGGLLALIGRAMLAPAEHAPAVRAQLPGLLEVVRESHLSTDAERRPSQPQIIIGLGLMTEAVHDLTAASDCWSLGVDHFHRTGAPGDEAWTLHERARIRIVLGELQEGLADAGFAHQVAGDLGLRTVAAFSAITLAMAHAWRGDNARASALLSHRTDTTGTDNLVGFRTRASWVTGAVALNENRHEDAWAALVAARGHPGMGLWSLGDLTEAAVRAGRTDEVRPLVESAQAEAAVFRSPHLDNLVHRSLAQIGDEPERHFEAALAAQSPAVLEVARTRLAYGQWLRRARRILHAREQLSVALRAFEAAGARPWADLAASELRAAGSTLAGSTDRKRTDAESLLTPKELQIARLAAAGMTNKEIADRIYVSHRTVGAHLYKIFPRLGVANRAQLRAALGDDSV